MLGRRQDTTRMSDTKRFAVILPAAGMSRRFKGAGETKSKLDASIAGKAAIVRSVELFTGRDDVCQVIIAVDPDGVSEFKFKWADKFALHDVTIVPGGKAERWETVKNALAAVSDEATHIAVHDAARPVADAAMIERVFAAAESFDAVVPAVPVHATIKRVGDAAATIETESGDPLDAIFGSETKQSVEAFDITETVAREGLQLAQTPQVFERKLLERAYEGLARGGAGAITDDAGLVEAMGERVVAVAGDAFNVKLTVPDDVAFAAAVVAMRSGSSHAAGDKAKRKHPTWAEMDED